MIDSNCYEVVSNLGVEVGHLKTARTNTLEMVYKRMVVFSNEYFEEYHVLKKVCRCY